MTNKKIAIMAIALAALSIPAFADSATTGVQASAQLSSTCTVSMGNVDFSYTPTSTASFTSKSINPTMTCTKGTAYTVSLSAGSSGDTSSRTMTSASGDVISYRIYGVSGVSYPFNTNPSNSTSFTYQPLTGTGAPVSMLLIGRVYTNQYVTPGSYSDTLAFTLTY
jgi:spore coat protein U-like protein